MKITERYVMALQQGLDRIHEGGRPALDLHLIHELHAVLMQDDAGRCSANAALPRHFRKRHVVPPTLLCPAGEAAHWQVRQGVLR